MFANSNISPELWGLYGFYSSILLLKLSTAYMLTVTKEQRERERERERERHCYVAMRKRGETGRKRETGREEEIQRKMETGREEKSERKRGRDRQKERFLYFFIYYVQETIFYDM